MTTLAEAWDDEAQALPADTPPEQVVALKRLFYRAALFAAGMPREQLGAELLAHGRSIGTPAERATIGLPVPDREPWPLPRRRA